MCFDVVLVGYRRVLFYVLQLIVTRFSRRSCLFVLFDEQRHLVRYFRGILVPPAEYSNFVCIFLICWCLVSVWRIVGQFVFFALVKILAEGILS